MKKLNFQKIKAIFFDFDGVIANTEWLHFKTFNEVLSKYDIKISKKEYMEKFLAHDDKGCFKKVFELKKKQNISLEKIRELILEKNKMLMKEISRGFKYYKSTIDFINYIYNKNTIKLCIVSGALRKEIIYILKKLKIFKKFSLIISSENVKNGKPSPEPFIFAKNQIEKIQKKELKNNEILVIEDSINGIKAAKTAGFITVAVTHTYPMKELKKSKPHIVVKSLKTLIQ